MNSMFNRIVQGELELIDSENSIDGHIELMASMDSDGALNIHRSIIQPEEVRQFYKWLKNIMEG